MCANIYLLLISVFYFVYSFVLETLPTLRGNPFATTKDDADKTYLPMSDSDGRETESDVSSDDNSTENVLLLITDYRV